MMENRAFLSAAVLLLVLCPAVYAVKIRPLLFATQTGSLAMTQEDIFCMEDTYDADGAEFDLRLTSGSCTLEFTLFHISPFLQLFNGFRDYEGEASNFKEIRLKVSQITNDIPYKAVWQNGLKDKQLCAKVKCKQFFAACKYSLQLHRLGQMTPHVAVRNTLGPVCGFADMHLHQYSYLAFGGNWYASSHEGPFNRKGDEKVGFIDTGIHTYQQVHETWLRKAKNDGLSLAIVPAVNNDFICFGHTKYPCNDMASALRQIRAARRFAEKNRDWYEIAKDPWHARQIIHSGKMAVILAVEVSDLFPEKRGPWKEQLMELYNAGVRSINAVHEVDNRFAGAAPHMLLIEILQFFTNGHPFLKNAQGENRVGLSEDGKALFTEFMRLNMLIDTTHLSRASASDVISLTEPSNYPIMDSHTRFQATLSPEQETHLREFVCDPKRLEAIKRRHGVVGLRTDQAAFPTYTSKNSSVPRIEPCDGSTASMAAQVLYAEDNDVMIGLGSDLNGFGGQTGPRFGPDACPSPSATVNPKDYRNKQVARQKMGVGTEYDTKGMATVGFEGDFIRDLKVLGVPTRMLERSAENVLRMWELAYPGEANRNLGKPYASCDHLLKVNPVPITPLTTAQLKEQLPRKTATRSAMERVKAEVNTRA